MNAYALTTVARYKDFAGITGTSLDTKIEIIIDIVSDWVEHYCDRRFIETTYTNEVYDGTGSPMMLLKNYPISSVASFQVDERDSDMSDAGFSMLDTNRYHIDYAAGIIELTASRFAEAPRKYQVTYTAGYAFKNDADPLVTLESLGIGDLEYAVWKIINNVLKKSTNVSGIKSESIGNYSVTYGDYQMWDVDIKMILNKYKRPHSM